jgi:hypothetical protein
MPDLDWSKCPVVESVPGKVTGVHLVVAAIDVATPGAYTEVEIP